MHTHNVNVKTATEESSRKMSLKPIPLTDSQIIDLFDWVFAATDDMPGAQCHDFMPPADAEEINVFFDDVPDYYAIWILKGLPVAAAMPLDAVFRVLSD